MSNTDKLEKLVESGSLTLRYSHKSEKKMTGAEWYDRFEKELVRIHKPVNNNPFTNFTYPQIAKAAKKASGIE